MFTQGQQTSLTEKNMHVGNEYTFTQKFKHSDKLYAKRILIWMYRRNDRIILYKRKNVK